MDEQTSPLSPMPALFQGNLSQLIPGLAEAVRDGAAIDLAVSGGLVPEEADGIESSLVIRIDRDATPGALAELPGGRRFILLRNMLQHIRDHRSILRAAFSKLAVEGWLIVTVPHQFLYERKFRPPSRYASSAARFYTPASLLLEIEAALDPTEYRVRLLQDDDAEFEYDAPLSRPPTGHKRILLAVQKIAQPPWAGHMADDDGLLVNADRRGVVASAQEGQAITHVIGPAPGKVERILVLKLDHRGDYQMAEPALRLLRSQYPNAHITLVTGPWNKESAEASSLFDEIIPFKYFAEDASMEGDPPRVPLWRDFAKMFEHREFDLALDLRTSSDTRGLLERVRARSKAGLDNWYAFPWLDIRLSLPSPTIEGRIEQGFLGLEGFESLNHPKGAPNVQFRRLTPGSAGTSLIWGPYCNLAAGEYEFELLIDCFADEQNLAYDVCTNFGDKILTEGVLNCTPDQSSYKIWMPVARETTRVEFRIRSLDENPLNFRFSGVRFRRSGQYPGVHQREAMLLLVNLVAVRLADPFEVRTY